MTEPNAPPICPCGFYGSPQTLGLCSKCFREREQNRNQATADITRPSPSSSNTDQSRVSLPTSTGLVVNTGTGFPHPQSYLDAGAPPSTAAATANVSTGTQTCNTDSASTTGLANDKPPPTTLIDECSDDVAHERRGKKRKREKEVEDDIEDGSPAKRDRPSHSSKHCHMCNCRLELAVREVGKCKCGFVFCLLHRLPEQHDCTFDHKEDGRREARAKMVPARKHVGTTLKRLDGF